MNNIKVAMVKAIKAANLTPTQRQRAINKITAKLLIKAAQGLAKSPASRGGYGFSDGFAMSGAVDPAMAYQAHRQGPPTRRPVDLGEYHDAFPLGIGPDSEKVIGMMPPIAMFGGLPSAVSRHMANSAVGSAGLGAQTAVRGGGAAMQRLGPGGFRALPTNMQRLGNLLRGITPLQSAGIGAAGAAGVGGAYGVSQMGRPAVEGATEELSSQPGTHEKYLQGREMARNTAKQEFTPDLDHSGLATDYGRLQQIAGNDASPEDINSVWADQQERRRSQHQNYRQMQAGMNPATIARFQAFMNSRAQQARDTTTDGDPQTYIGNMQRARAQAMRDWRRQKLTQ